MVKHIQYSANLAHPSTCEGFSLEGKDFSGGFSKVIKIETPHTEVILDFRLYVLGDWQREPLLLQIDDQSPIQLLAPYSKHDHTLEKWCGFAGFKDNIVRINRGFNHTTEKLTFKIFEQGASSSDKKSWGLSDISVKLVVQCPANSVQNNQGLCTCKSGFYSIPQQPCPSKRNDICQKCLPCNGYCRECLLENSKVSCKRCSEGFTLENGACVVKEGKF